MANTKISNAAAIAAVDAVTALINAGGAGTVEIYDGAQPADVSVAVSGQTLLATLTLSATAFAGAVDNTGSAQATAAAITGENAAVAGTATWFRVKSGAGTAILDGDVGTSGTDMVLSNNVFQTNDTVDITSWTITLSE